MPNFSVLVFVDTLVDGTFSQAALKGKIQLKEQLPKYFGGEIKLGNCMDVSDSVTSCPLLTLTPKVNSEGCD